MNLKSNENTDNNNIKDILKKYEELLIWINSIDSPLFKNVKNVEDLKDGNIFIHLLKYYFQQNKQKYYEGILNSAIRNKSSIEKMKIIFNIFLQLTNNNEINSRIIFFQKDINNFLRNNEFLMELVLYIKYLYKINIYNGNKLYKNKEKDLKNNFYKNNSFYNYKQNKLSKRTIKDFYDYNKYKRVIINNFLNNNNENKNNKIENNKQYNDFPDDNKNILNKFKFIKKNDNSKNDIRNSKINNEIHTYIYKPKSFTKKINSNFYDLNNKSITPHYNNIIISSKYNENLNNKKNIINLTDKNNDFNNKNEIKKKIFIMEEEDKSKDLLIDLDKKNNICYSSFIQTKNKNHKYNNNIEIDKDNNRIENKKNFIFGLFFNDKIDNYKGGQELPIYKIYNLTNPIILNKEIFEKLSYKLNKNKELFNIKNDSNEKIREKEETINNQYLNKNLGNSNIENYTSHFPVENIKKEYFSFLEKEKNDKKKELNENNNLIENDNLFEKKIKRHNSYLLGMNKQNQNNLNNFSENIKNVSYLNFYNNNKNSNMKSFSDKNLFHDNSKIIIDNNDIKRKKIKDKKINKDNIYKWLLEFNIIKKGETSIITLPQIVSDGIILIDIINRFTEESNQINEKDIYRNISSKEEALININKALDYLKNIKDFPKRHVLDNELIFEIDDKAIWELLYDLYKYYSKKIKKRRNENNNQNNNLINNLNSISDLNKNRKEFWSRNDRGRAFEIADLYSHDKNTSNKIYNKKIKTINEENLFNNNYERDKKFIANSYNPNYGINNIKDINNGNNNININFVNNAKYQNNKDNNNYDNMIINQNNIEKNEPFSFSLKRNLSSNYESSKLNNIGYFDYVNELKKKFDQNKIKNISKNNENTDIRKSYFYHNKNNYQNLNYKKNLHFNYNEHLNNKKNDDYDALNNKYINTDYNNRKSNL